MANEINVQLGEPHIPRIGLERIMYSPTTIIHDVNPATTEEAGIVELATSAETLAGTDDERAVTPAGLHSTVGEAGGIAGLDEHGKIPSGQLPSYVDDVIEGYLYNNHFYKDSAHTELVDNDQESGIIYIEKITDLTYRWGGSVYVEISKSLALGETSTTAYRGDRGKIAYDHATDASRITTAQTSGIYKMSVTSEGHVAGVEDARATTAEAKSGTATEKVMTPKTNRDAHDAWHWFGTQSEFDALAPDYDPDVIYHVEASDMPLGLKHSTLASGTTHVSFGEQPEYKILASTSDITVTIDDIRNNEKNYLLIYTTEATPSIPHGVTIESLGSALSGYTVIGKVKGVPFCKVNPFKGNSDIINLDIKGLEFSIVKSDNVVILSYSMVGYKG